MAIAVQQGDGAAAVASGGGLSQAILQVYVQVQRLHLAAVSRQPAADLDHPGGQGLGSFDLEGEDEGLVLVADQGEIGKAVVHKQQHRLPCLSSRALVATVVPRRSSCTTTGGTGAEGSNPTAWQRVRMAGSPGSSGCSDSTFRTTHSPSGPSPTRSVKVPPRSIQNRQPGLR